MLNEPRWRRYLQHLGRGNVGRDVDDELTFHFEQRVAEFMAAGATREEAQAEARRRFGDVTRTQTELRHIDQRVRRRRDRADLLDQLRSDLVFMMRGLRRSPGFAVACILTIALGVGANGAMFSLADRLFVRPPAGVRDPGGIRRLYVRTTATFGQVAAVQSGFAIRTFTLLDTNLAPRMQLAGYTSPDTMPMVVQTASSSSQLSVHGSYVSERFMSVLGVRPAVGRFFTPEEQKFGTPVHVAVISDRLWRRAFGGDSSVIGATADISRQRTTIIGVAPQGFDGPDLGAAEVWMPLPSQPAPADGRWYSDYFFGGMNLRMLGRVAPGTSDEWIANAATTVIRRTRVEMGEGGPMTNPLRDSAAVMLPGPILESLAPSMSPRPEVAITARLVGVTIIVLLIACANVASLLLARAIGRRREIAVRIALGVSRRRLVAQLLSEGIALAVAAAVAAIIVSMWAAKALRALVMPDTYWADSAIDLRVLAFILGVATLTGVLAALVPALQASRPELTEALKSGSRDGGANAHRTRLRQSLLVAQVAMSVVLLYCAGLFVRSVVRLREIDLGFDADRVIYGSVYSINPNGMYIDQSSRNSAPVAQGIMETAQRLSTMPAVERVAVSGFGGPLGGFAMIGLYMQDGSAAPRLEKRDPVWNAVTPGFFDATGTRLVRGRLFGDADRGNSNLLVINETAARFFWPHQDAIGQCLRLFVRTSPCSTIIGIVRDSHVRDVVEGPMLQLTTPFAYDSLGTPRRARSIVVRAKPGQTAAVKAELRRALQRAFPTLTVPVVRSVSETMSTQLRPWRVGLLLFAGFGVLALLVAALGTYSVLSYGVTQRQHEIGVRVALGARAWDVVRLIMLQGVRIAAVGVVLGLVIALAAARVVQSLLYDTTWREPVVTVAVAALLVAIAAIASAVPARRAARIDPVDILRAE